MSKTRSDQEAICFAITGAFEGGGYLNRAGNFDGSGWSLGFLQWNFGQGTLQSLLLDFKLAGPITFRRHLPGRMADELLAICRGPKDRAITWANSHSTGQGKRQIVEPWNSALKSLLQEPGLQAVQRKHAACYMADAHEDADHYGIKTLRGLALMFDVAVQNGMGRLGDNASSRTRGIFQRKGGYALPYDKKLLALADAVAESANPKWVEDVRARKRAIALGRGKSHGKTWDLEAEFGLNDEALL